MRVANDPSLWWDNKILISKTRDYLEKNKSFPTKIAVCFSGRQRRTAEKLEF
jgi:hypothetical protein